MNLLPPALGQTAPNPAVVYIGTMQTPESKRSVRAALNRIARFFTAGATAATFPWHELRYEDVQRLRGHLAETLAPITANSRLSMMRRTLHTAWRLGLLDAEELARLNDVERVRGSRLPPGRALSLEEVKALIEAAGRDVRRWRGRRDAALVAILYCAGLRREEAARLQLADLDEREGRLRVRVLGKGNKERRVPLPRDVRPTLDAWREARGRTEGPLFPARSREGQKLHGKPMHGRTVAAIVKRLIVRASLEHASPHDFRRTFISSLLDESGDVAAIRDLAGHADVKTTLGYDRRGERALERAVDKLPSLFGG